MAGSWSGSMQTSLQAGTDPGSTASGPSNCEAAASPRPQDRALGHTLNHWTSSCDCGKRRVLGCVRSVGALGSVYYGTLQRL